MRLLNEQIAASDCVHGPKRRRHPKFTFRSCGRLHSPYPIRLVACGWHDNDKDRFRWLQWTHEHGHEIVVPNVERRHHGDGWPRIKCRRRDQHTPRLWGTIDLNVVDSGVPEDTQLSADPRIINPPYLHPAGAIGPGDRVRVRLKGDAGAECVSGPLRFRNVRPSCDRAATSVLDLLVCVGQNVMRQGMRVWTFGHLRDPMGDPNMVWHEAIGFRQRLAGSFQYRHGALRRCFAETSPSFLFVGARSIA